MDLKSELQESFEKRAALSFSEIWDRAVSILGRLPIDQERIIIQEFFENYNKK